MNALLLATMVLSAAAMDEAALRSTAEFVQIQDTANDIAERISTIKLKASDFNLDNFDWISENDDTADEDWRAEATSALEMEQEDIDEDTFEPFDESTQTAPGLKKNPPPTSHLHKKRSCKAFEDTRFTINAKDKFAIVFGYTWESCLKSCEDNLLCAQVIFDKDKKECNGYRIANSNTVAGVAPEKFMSGHCQTEVEESLGAKAAEEPAEDGVVEDTSILQTEDKSEVKVDAVVAEFEEQMKMEEQLAIAERATAQEKPEASKKPWNLSAANYWSKKPSLKLRQKVGKKCTTFETENLTKKGSLLQMGKKLLTSESTGDFLTCLQKCQKDATCKQVVYDKQASQCYKHDEVVVKKSNANFMAKGTKYIAATCQ